MSCRNGWRASANGAKSRSNQLKYETIGQKQTNKKLVLEIITCLWKLSVVKRLVVVGAKNCATLLLWSTVDDASDERTRAALLE